MYICMQSSALYAIRITSKLTKCHDVRLSSSNIQQMIEIQMSCILPYAV